MRDEFRASQPHISTSPSIATLVDNLAVAITNLARCSTEMYADFASFRNEMRAHFAKIKANFAKVSTLASTMSFDGSVPVSEDAISVDVSGSGVNQEIQEMVAVAHQCIAITPILIDVEAKSVDSFLVGCKVQTGALPWLDDLRLMAIYCVSDDMVAARHMFDEMSDLSTRSWYVMISDPLLYWDPGGFLLTLVENMLDIGRISLPHEDAKPYKLDLVLKKGICLYGAEISPNSVSVGLTEASFTRFLTFTWDPKGFFALSFTLNLEDKVPLQDTVNDVSISSSRKMIQVAIVVILTFTIEDEQPEVQGRVLMLTKKIIATKSQNGHNGVSYTQYLNKLHGLIQVEKLTCWMITGERQAAKIRGLHLQTILRQDVSFFDEETNTEEVVRRISGDIVLIQDAMGEKVGQFIQLIATFLGGFVIAFIRGWPLTVVMLSCILLILMSMVIAKASSSGQTDYSTAASVVEQAIGSIQTVALFTEEKQTIAKYNQSLIQAYKTGVQEAISYGLEFGSLFFVYISTYVLAVWFGGKMTIRKGYTGGKVVTVIFFDLTGSMSLGQVLPSLGVFAAGQAATFKMFETIKRKPEIDSYYDTGQQLGEIRGEIELRKVCFSYPTRPDEMILNGFSLSTPSGTTADETIKGGTFNEFVPDSAAIASSIQYHDVFTTSFSPEKLELSKALFATAKSVRDSLIINWNAIYDYYEKMNVKQAYYMSMEYLQGRALLNAIGNLQLSGPYVEALKKMGHNSKDVANQEPDAALGNGGLGRLASCFLDSLATLNYPEWGYGLRYKYGLFKQLITKDGQEEVAESWLEMGNPWEILRNDVYYPVRLYGEVISGQNGSKQWIGGVAFIWTGSPS